MAKRWNLFKAGANLIHRRLTPWSMPLHMQIELTDYCNLRCPVCPTGIRAVTRRPLAMPVALFRRLIDEVGPYLLTVSLWGWGESLLHPELMELLRLARKHRVAILVSTNGQNLDNDRVIEALIEAPPTYLIVAIDGLTDATNSQFRVGASLAPVLAGVKRLAEIKRQRGLRFPVLHMRYIVMKHNQHELSQLREFAVANYFDLLSIRALSVIDNESAVEIHQQLIPDIPEYRAYKYENGARIRRDDFICLEPFWFPSVFVDGTVVHCAQDYNANHALGAIGNGTSFRDVWFSESAALARKTVRDEPAAVKCCRNCPARDRPRTDVSMRLTCLRDGIQQPTVI